MTRFLFLVATLLDVNSSWAQQSYPNRLIRLIVAFPPGGAADAFGRIIGPPLAEALGRPVVASVGWARFWCPRGAVTFTFDCVGKTKNVLPTLRLLPSGWWMSANHSRNTIETIIELASDVAGLRYGQDLVANLDE